MNNYQMTDRLNSKINKTKSLEVSHASLQGDRDANEDAEGYVLNNVNNHDSKLFKSDVFVLCDGHGGADVANYVKDRLLNIFTNQEGEYPNLDPNYNDTYSCKNRSKYEEERLETIIDVYDQIQDELKTHKEKIAEKMGTTALVSILYHIGEGKSERIKLQVMNLGDCRAVMSKKGIAVVLSYDHKPSWPKEKERINQIIAQNKSNDKIHYDDGDWRIGDLSVSRAFGDLDNAPYISHLPDIETYDVTNHVEFVVMACDGVWDVLENHKVINFVADNINDNHPEFYDITKSDVAKNKNLKEYRHKNHLNDDIATRLAKFAIANGSKDNVSVFVIPIDS